MILHHLRKRLLISYGVLVVLLTLSFFSYLYVTATQQRQIAAQDNLDLLNQSIHIMLKKTFNQYQPTSKNSAKSPSMSAQESFSANIDMEVVEEVTSFIRDLGLDYPLSVFFYNTQQTESYKVTIAPVVQPEYSILSINEVIYLKSEKQIMDTAHPLYGFRTGLETEYQQIIKPSEIFSLNQFLSMLLIILTSLLIVFMVSDFIAKPITDFAKVARKITSLNLAADNIFDKNTETDFVTDTSIWEVQHLAISLTSMMRKIKKQQLSLIEFNENLEQKVQERTDQLNQINAELLKISRRDALTGLNNRLALDEMLRHDFIQYQRSETPYTVMLLDIDYFKEVNDRHGHAVGDSVLKELGKCLSNCMRETDFVARYGGEEFLIILPNTVQYAFILAEKLRTVIASIDFPTVGHLTVSIGLSVVEASDQEPEDAVRRADQALYLAKEEGRNQAKMI